MRTIAFLLVLFLASSLAAANASASADQQGSKALPGWLTDFAKAQAEASKTRKPVFCVVVADDSVSQAYQQTVLTNCRERLASNYVCCLLNDDADLPAPFMNALAPGKDGAVSLSFPLTGFISPEGKLLKLVVGGATYMKLLHGSAFEDKGTLKEDLDKFAPQISAGNTSAEQSATVVLSCAMCRYDACKACAAAMRKAIRALPGVLNLKDNLDEPNWNDKTRQSAVHVLEVTVVGATVDSDAKKDRLAHNVVSAVEGAAHRTRDNRNHCPSAEPKLASIVLLSTAPGQAQPFLSHKDNWLKLESELKAVPGIAKVLLNFDAHTDKPTGTITACLKWGLSPSAEMVAQLTAVLGKIGLSYSTKP